MTVERISGGYLCSDIVAGHLVQHRYLYYTKREAVRLFKERLRDLHPKKGLRLPRNRR